MLIEYNNQIKNQAQFHKKLNLTSLSHKNILTDHRGYLTNTEYHIYQLLKQYNHHEETKFKNRTIANRVGCTIRTVQRATNKLLKAGLITKTRQDIYAVNQYSIQCEYVTPYKSLILDKYLFRRTITKTIPSLRAGMRVRNSIVSKESKNIQKSNEERRNMNEFQRKWILKYKNEPSMKDVLSTPKARAALFNSTLENLAKILELTDREKLNLVPFDEETLSYVFNQVYPVIEGYTRISKPIDNKMAWVIGIAKVYCKENNLKADWQWYFDLCDIFGFEKKNSDSKPLVIKNNAPRKESYKGEYGAAKQIQRQPEALSPEEQLRRWKGELQQREDRIAFYGVKPSIHDEKVIAQLKEKIAGATQEPKKWTWDEIKNILPLEDRVSKWQSEITKLQARYDDFPAADPFGLKDVLAVSIKNAKQELLDSEMKLRREDEKQKVLREHGSYIMAEDGEEHEQVLRTTDNQQGIFWSAPEPTA